MGAGTGGGSGCEDLLRFCVAGRQRYAEPLLGRACAGSSSPRSTDTPRAPHLDVGVQWLRRHAERAAGGVRGQVEEVELALARRGRGVHEAMPKEVLALREVQQLRHEVRSGGWGRRGCGLHQWGGRRKWPSVERRRRRAGAAARAGRRRAGAAPSAPRAACIGPASSVGGRVGRVRDAGPDGAGCPRANLISANWPRPP